MSEYHAPEDAQKAFRIVMAVIAGIVVLGVVLLITVVLTYRLTPGRQFPFVEGTPTSAPSPAQST